MKIFYYTLYAIFALASAAAITPLFVKIFRRSPLLACPLLLAISAYLICGFLIEPICGFQPFNQSAVNDYQRTCVNILGPSQIILFLSSILLPLPFVILGASVASFIALMYLVVDAFLHRSKAS